MKREIIDGLMPAFFALIGVIFGTVALFVPNVQTETRNAALAVASSAIVGAAGLAQPERKG
ncbi:hypothetical protein [Floridanema evergladense]|uniref:Uncharacterized protein n=1 Tax=Floridaenema evergladense BLCC-F167 TaxID=3153639 RepID=A0ABV4WD32_9CYAN